MSHRPSPPRSPAEVRFRAAEHADVAAVVDLVQRAYRGDPGGDGWTTEAHLLGGQRTDAGMVAASLADPDSRLVVAERSDELVGCCQLRRPEGAAHATLGLFAVRPDLQGTGVGGAVLDEGERLARDGWGRRRMRLEVIDVRGELIAWYRRRGYEPTGATTPFPYGDPRFGLPRRPDLRFVVLEKPLER